MEVKLGHFEVKRLYFQTDKRNLSLTDGPPTLPLGVEPVPTDRRPDSPGGRPLLAGVRPPPLDGHSSDTTQPELLRYPHIERVLPLTRSLASETPQ